jgi:hypothetical protein
VAKAKRFAVKLALSIRAPDNRTRSLDKRRRTSDARRIDFAKAGQVAVGDFSPTAPTDPYVPILEHTVPLMLDSPYS